MPNERFEEFADRFMKSIGEPDCDLQALVDELIELHAVERDEFNRVRLISMHIALTNIAAEGLAKAQVPGSQIIGFLADNLSTYHLMLRQESLVDGQIDKAVLLRVTERERATIRSEHLPKAANMFATIRWRAFFTLIHRPTINQS